MSESAKKDFDPEAKTLIRAARENKAGLCGKFYGTAGPHNTHVNARALRIAAESQNYEAFERMMDVAGEKACGVSSSYDIAPGKDWDKVTELAQNDERLQKALDRYQQRADLNIRYIKEALHKNDKPDGPKPS